MTDEPEYHDGLPVLPSPRARKVTERVRIQIIGVRAGWSAWAAREAARALLGPGGDAASDKRWQELMAVDKALRAAETRLEAAIEYITKEAER